MLPHRIIRIRLLWESVKSLIVHGRDNSPEAIQVLFSQKWDPIFCYSRDNHSQVSASSERHQSQIHYIQCFEEGNLDRTGFISLGSKGIGDQDAERGPTDQHKHDKNFTKGYMSRVELCSFKWNHAQGSEALKHPGRRKSENSCAGRFRISEMF